MFQKYLGIDNQLVTFHYSCPKFYWDSRHQCIKKGFSNAAVINAALNKLKSSIIAKRDEYIRLGIEYTPSMLLSKDESEEVKLSNRVSDLIDSYYKEKELRGRSVNTLATYVQELSEENDLVDAVSVMQ